MKGNRANAVHEKYVVGDPSPPPHCKQNAVSLHLYIEDSHRRVEGISLSVFGCPQSLAVM